MSRFAGLAIALATALGACRNPIPLPSAPTAPPIGPEPERTAAVASPPDATPNVDPAESAVRDEEAQWLAAEPERQRLVANPRPQLGEACRVHYDAELGALVLGDVPVFFPFGDGFTNHFVGSEARIVPIARRGEKLLVAFGTGPTMPDPLITYNAATDSPEWTRLCATLWSIDCHAPRVRPERLREFPGVDFGQAVPSPDGDAFLLTNAEGIARLDVPSLTLTPFVPNPPLAPDDAWMLDLTEPRASRLVRATRWTKEGLLVEAGHPELNCHGGESLTPYWLDPNDPAMRVDPARWVPPLGRTRLVEAGQGGVWLASESFANPWKSEDGGATWHECPLGVPAPVESSDDWNVSVAAARHSSVADLLLDRADPKRILIRTGIVDVAQNAVGGDLYLSKDGGRRWVQLGIGTLSDEVRTYGPLVSAVASVDGSLTHLRIAVPGTVADAVGEPGDREDVRPDTGDGADEATLETHDGGRTWTRVPSADVEEMPPTPRLTLAGSREGAAEAVLEVLPAAIVRRTPAGESVTVFPPPHALPRIAVRDRPEDLDIPRASVTWTDWIRADQATTRGLAALQRRAYGDAVVAFDEARRANPNDARAVYHAARAYARLGRPEAATAALETLSMQGGYRALALLATARGDRDLASLRKLPRFQWLTTVAAPAPVYAVSLEREPNEARLSDAGLLVDPTGRLCLTLDGELDEEQVLFVGERFDCVTGERSPSVRWSAEEAAAWADDLAMRPAHAIEEGTPDHADAVVWARRALGPDAIDGDLLHLYRAPGDGHLIALLRSEVDGAWKVEIAVQPLAH